MSSTLITIVVLAFWLSLIVAIGLVAYKLFQLERSLRELAANSRRNEEPRQSE
ncbi:hypothetical protein ACFWGD_01695 [Corynebacterium sp. NPDC060344]|uniref:hypothetical protein n=1 Tax=Corynebacterium sp. NPDC060344 TaxID=3347101 RepID=UPI003663FD18